MWQFNLVVTMASGGRFRRLLDELAPHGDFRRTEFFGVVLGEVPDVELFLEILHRQRAERCIAFQDVGRVIPLRRVFTFTLETFLQRAREVLRPWLAELAGRRFYVRLERRGLKGRLLSPEAERALDAWIADELAARGESATIDFAAPEAVVVLETVGDRCGVSLLPRALLERYPLVRVA